MSDQWTMGVIMNTEYILVLTFVGALGASVFDLCVRQARESVGDIAALSA
jgi:hypothetical protein